MEQATVVYQERLYAIDSERRANNSVVAFTTSLCRRCTRITSEI